jgi:hypothetical protein
MRVRMLDRPEVIDYVNSKTVPLMWTVTGRGLPDLPAFRFWQRSYDTNPWPHIAFAVFFLIDPAGERAYGASGCGFLEAGGALAGGYENLQMQMARYEKARSLAAMGEDGAQALAEHLARVREDTRRWVHCFHDPRLQTFRSLLGRRTAKWPELLAALRPRGPEEPEVVEFGLREAVIHALADFLFDDSPFHEDATPHLRRLYHALSANDRRAWRTLALEPKGDRRNLSEIRAGDVPIPPSIRGVAARSLVVLADLEINPEDPELAVKLRAWWEEHASDPEYRVPW